jgi:hypothetical protein
VHQDWPKKTGKSTLQGDIGLRELLVAPEPDREIIAVGNDTSVSPNTRTCFARHAF